MSFEDLEFNLHVLSVSLDSNSSIFLTLFFAFVLITLSDLNLFKVSPSTSLIFFFTFTTSFLTFFLTLTNSPLRANSG
jgi:hypothetical protein